MGGWRDRHFIVYLYRLRSFLRLTFLAFLLHTFLLNASIHSCICLTSLQNQYNIQNIFRVRYIESKDMHVLAGYEEYGHVKINLVFHKLFQVINSFSMVFCSFLVSFGLFFLYFIFPRAVFFIKCPWIY